jgi:hypothetical protein
MRILAAWAMLTVIVPVAAIAASLTATAPSGVKTRVAEHVALDRSCKPQRIVLTIATPPANGSATTGQEDLPLKANTKLGGEQDRCVGTVAPNAVVYYQSRPNFTGQDRFKYQRVNQDDPNDRLNGEVVITVTVK